MSRVAGDGLHRAAAPACAGLLLAACAGGAEIDETVAWRAETTPAGRTLTAADVQGPVLRLACDGDRFTLQAFRFTPVASNEELAFGTADETVLLVADPAAAAEGVAASGALPIPVLTSLMSAGAVSAVYGDQALGPLILPANEADPFVGACLS